MKFTKYKFPSVISTYAWLSNIKIGVEYFNWTLTNKTDFQHQFANYLMMC